MIELLAVVPGVAALAAGAVRWRAWRYPRRGWRRTSPGVRLAVLLLAALAFGACHSIERGAWAHGPVPTAKVPFTEPIKFSIGPDAGTDVPLQNGVLASYFAGAMYERLDHQQVDANIDFEWDASGDNPVVSGPDGIDTNEGDPFLPPRWPIWSIAWEGYLEIPSPGSYRFRLHVNNGGWLEMKDGSGGLTTVISCPGASGFEGDCFGVADLPAGRAYLRVSYFNNAPSSANAHLAWQGPSDAGYSIIPSASLFTQAGDDGDVIALSYGEDPISGISIAEPVNTFSGNFTTSTVDLAFPGRGPSLRLARSYNARDTHSGVFGTGWTSGLEWQVTVRGADAVVTRGDGRRDVHKRQPDGTYRAPAGVFDVLTRVPGDGWRLVTPEQLTLEFGTSGAIRRLADRNGNALTFTTDGAGRVTSLADGAGRSIAFEYAAAGTLVRASDTAGRAVSFRYTARRLSAATDATGGVTAYAYDAAGRLATITDPLGIVVLTNTYDTAGRVTEQRDAVGGSTRFAYDAATKSTTVTSPRGTTTTVRHDQNGRAVTLTDGLGAAVTYAYDARGSQTSFRDRNGNAWRFGYDARGNRTQVTDSVGGIARFTFDTQNNLLTRTDPLGNTWRYSYDARGDLATVTDPEGGVTRIDTDALGQVTKITDADGVAVAYAYDAAGNVISVTSPAGTAATAYDAAGRPAATTDPNGNRTTFTYDALDRLTGSTDALGAPSTLAYDASGNLVQTVDRRGALTKLVYDPQRRLVRIIDALGGITDFRYDASGNRTAIIDAAGKTLSFAYDARDRLASVTDAEGGTSRFSYDANGNLVASVDPRGNTAGATYNFRNQRETAVDRFGQITRFTYDAAGRMVSSTDPLGATTSVAYDRTGRPTATTDALAGLTRTAYTAAGRRAALTDPNGNRTAFGYDAAGRLATLTDALGSTVTYAYDPNGNRIARTDQLGRTTRFAYDALDRLAATTDVLGGRTALTYDPAGALASVQDARGNTTAYRSDALGRLVAVTDALGGVTSYAYDARGLLTGLVDANGHPRSYAYDGNRRLVRETDGLGRARTYTYDLNGNPLRALDPKGQPTAFGYDAENRLASMRYADGTTVQLSRDAVGNRVGMVDSVGTTTFAYDRLRRLTATSDPFGQTVAYGYDHNGNRASLRYPDGTTATYGYDALDRLTQVADGIGGLNTYQYDAAGNQTAADFANGSASRATYDPLDRVSSITNRDGRGTAASRFAYSYDPVGNLTSERAGRGEDGHASAGQDTGATTYRYDALSRLVAVVGGEHDRTTYRYDPVGNRTAAIVGDEHDAGALGATFDAADQLTALVRPNGRPAVQFSYDPNGNLLTRTGADDRSASFSYDAADRLTTVADPEQGTTTYRYDGDGTLLSETATNPRARDEDHRPASPVTLQYTIDRAAPRSQILAATDGPAVARYLYGTARIASWGPVTRYYGTDVRGSVRSMTDGSGTRVGTRGYDAWGIPTAVDATDHGRDGRTDLTTLFGYTGERQDASTGLVYLRARWYEPTAGRFLTRDPFRGTAGDPRSLSPYAYAQNNPTSRVDPTGFSAAGLFDGASGYAPNYAGLYAGFPALASFGSPSNVPPMAIAPDGGGGPLQYAADVGGGFLGGAWSAVAGVAKVAQGAWNSTAACAYDKQSCSTQWAANRALGSFVVDHPGDFAGAVVEGAIANCREGLFGSHGGAAVGGCAFDVLSAVVGLKGLDKLKNLGRAGDVVSVYQSVNKTTGLVDYVGMTSRLAQRAAEHFGEKGITIRAIKGLTRLSREDARAVEQVLIEQYGLGKNGGSLLNKINSIAETNPIYEDAIQRGTRLLRDAKYAP